jgi:hypothetical protein
MNASKTVISIAKQFSPTPAGRYVSDGPFPGETFREKWLTPALDAGGTVTVNLDGTAGYGSSFLEEAFGGLVRRGWAPEVLRGRLVLVSNRPSYVERIWSYIEHGGEAAR